MRILYVVHKYDYGQAERGHCFEHYNFYASLVGMGHEVIYFDFPTIAMRLGRDQMNRRLVEVVKQHRPDLMFTVVWQNHLDPVAIQEISRHTGTVTLNWYCDDHWQFDRLSRHWTPCFNWVVTTADRALPNYARLGYSNVIKSQWACSHLAYRKLDLPMKYDVTFVGLPHGVRPAAIQAVRDAGIDVRVWGTGWGTGRLTHQQMVRVFNQSRINLNFSEASSSGGATDRLKRVTHRYIQRPLLAVPGGWRVQAAGRTLWSKMPGDWTGRLLPKQIKGRHFEVPGCGGFLLTGDADRLSDHYQIGKEIAVFGSIPDLIEKIRYYLDHEQERASIARAGHERTLREHTYAHRFHEIFAKIGLPGTIPGRTRGRLVPSDLAVAA